MKTLTKMLRSMWFSYLAAVGGVTALVALFLFPALAFAQDAGVTPDGGVALTLSDDPAQQAQMIIDAIAHKQWWMVASVGVLFVTWAIRNPLASLSPKLQAALQNPIVSWALPTVVATAGAVTTTLVAGQPLNFGTLAPEILKVAFGAIGLYMGAKKVAEARAAGAAAAAEVKTTGDAIKVLAGSGTPPAAPPAEPPKGPNP